LRGGAPAPPPRGGHAQAGPAPAPHLVRLVPRHSAKVDAFERLAVPRTPGVAAVGGCLTSPSCQPGSGGPGGLHPRAPPERSVTVSRHSAPAILIISGVLTQAQWAK